MKSRTNKLFLIVVYIAALITGAVPVFADEGTAAPGSFTYNVIHPENQHSQAGYFDLRMQPGQVQKVQIELTNSSDEKELTVGVSLNSTKTNGNGVLEYGPSSIENDKSLDYDFVDIVKAPETITLEPGETKALDLEIKMPQEAYEGVIAGGIQLGVVPTDEEKKAMADRQGVVNKFVYVVGMLLTETDSTVPADLEFNRFYAGLNNYRNAVFADFSNVKMGFMSGMTIDMQVMKKGSTEVLYDTKKADMKMAPNSKIDFPLVMNGDQMEAGEYTGHLLVTSGEQKWEWTEDFTITQEEADKYNKQDVTLTQERGINWFLIAGIVAGVLVLVIMVFFVVRTLSSRKKKERAKKRKKRSNTEIRK